jgi:hypothetical protein
MTLQYLDDSSQLSDIGLLPPPTPGDLVNWFPFLFEEGLDLTEEARAYGVAIGEPLFGQTGCSTHNKASAMYSVEKRVDEPRPAGMSKREMERKLQVLKRHILELCNMLFPGRAESLEPYELYAVDEAMCKPGQRLDFQKNVHLIGTSEIEGRKVTIVAFLKSEVTGTPGKAPRTISPVDIDQKIFMSCFTLAISSMFKETPYYAFGKSPKEVAERIHEIGIKFKDAVETDYSKFDATLSYVIHCAMKFFAGWFFPKHHREVLHQLMDREVDATCWLLDIKYNLGTGRASGTPGTSIFNTMLNILMAYHTHRVGTDLISEGLSPEDSFERLGVYGGDDGNTPEVDPRHYERVTSQYGLKLTCSERIPSDQALKFLARVYPNRKESPGSFTDPVRFFSKFHISCSRERDPVELYARKASALFVSDRHTPLFEQARLGLEKSYPTITGRYGALRFTDAVNYLSQGVEDDKLYPGWDFVEDIQDFIQRESAADFLSFTDAIFDIERVGYRNWKGGQVAHVPWKAVYPVYYGGQIYSVGDGVDEHGDLITSPVEVVKQAYVPKQNVVQGAVVSEECDETQRSRPGGDPASLSAVSNLSHAPSNGPAKKTRRGKRRPAPWQTHA